MHVYTRARTRTHAGLKARARSASTPEKAVRPPVPTHVPTPSSRPGVHSAAPSDSPQWTALRPQRARGLGPPLAGLLTPASPLLDGPPRARTRAPTHCAESKRTRVRERTGRGAGREAGHALRRTRPAELPARAAAGDGAVGPPGRPPALTAPTGPASQETWRAGVQPRGPGPEDEREGHCDPAWRAVGAGTGGASRAHCSVLSTPPAYTTRGSAAGEPGMTEAAWVTALRAATPAGPCRPPRLRPPHRRHAHGPGRQRPRRG